MGDQISADSLLLPRKLVTLPSSHSISRASMRGVKICPSCGQLNGQRSKICRNENCQLRKQVLLYWSPFDPVRLTSLDKNISLYSLRCKEKSTQPRNFVKIISKDATQQVLCFNCQMMDMDMNFCKHIEACCTVSKDSNPLHSKTTQQAEVFTVAREVLWNLNGVSEDQKTRLWSLYQQEENCVPAVQRLNRSMFAVICEQSAVFPAGRLHVSVFQNGVSTQRTYFCSCKKLKIILESDNSVVMQDEVCDHILLVLAGILSNKVEKTAYGNFLNALKSFWVPSTEETPIVDSTHADALFGLNINIGGNFAIGNDESVQDDNIFVYGNEFLSANTDLQDIPDFDDINLVEAASAGNANSLNAASATSVPSYLQSSELLLAQYAEDFPDLSAVSNLISEAATHMELSDCNIELMDQFELTDKIDLAPSDDITLQSVQELCDNSASISAALTTIPAVNSIAVDPLLNDVNIAQALTVLRNNSLQTNQVLEAPPIELPIIEVVKKHPIKVSEIVNEVKTRKFPPLPAKRSLIINPPLRQNHCSMDNKMNTKTEQNKQPNTAQQSSCDDAPSLSYSAWLDYVIETINESITITEETSVQHNFHVHEEIFAHFSKSFSAGTKRRIPNHATMIKHGRSNGLIKYTWYFTSASTVKRIFQTKNITLETEGMFQRQSDGTFVPYVRSAIKPHSNDQRIGGVRCIFPKLSLYKSRMCFDYGSKDTKTGVKVEWVPNAFPKSCYGILNIEFSLKIEDPNQQTALLRN